MQGSPANVRTRDRSGNVAETLSDALRDRMGGGFDIRFVHIQMRAGAQALRPAGIDADPPLAKHRRELTGVAVLVFDIEEDEIGFDVVGVDDDAGNIGDHLGE